MAEARRARTKIKIFMRLRPTPMVSPYLSIDPIENSVEYDIPVTKAREYVNNARARHSYRFDGVFSGEATQDEVFEHVARDAVLTALDGVNSTVFAYGQTGSGKTFTITGGVERYADRGLIPRALSLLFEEFQKRTHVQYTAHISFLEIYQEKGYDLLAADHGKKSRKDLKKVCISEDAHGLLHLQNLSMHRVAREEDALNLLFLGDTHRAIAATSMNLNSSRSHCIFTINLEAREPGSDTIRRSKIHMVDLAGSERVSKSGTSGTTLDEAKAINGSLHFLEMVIVALQERTRKGNSRHVPFRNSMLTSVLRDSLGGNCETSMVATCSAEERNTGESISTCRFAQRVAQVENVAQVNEETDPTLQLIQKESEISALREELSLLREGSEEQEELTGDVLRWLKGQVTAYLSAPDPPAGKEGAPMRLGKITAKRVRAAFRFCKLYVREAVADVRARGGSASSGGGGAAQLADGGAMRGGGGGGSASRDRGRGERDHREGGASPAAAARRSVAPPRLSADLSPALRELVNANDRDGSYAEWKTVHPKAAAIGENLALLKSRIVEAKSTAAGVNRARGLIKTLKTQIEQLRMAHRLAAGDGPDSRDDDGEGSSASGGPVAGEAELIAEIENAKKEYHGGFDRLRILKSDTQGIQAQIERTRTKMRSDFEDMWNSRGVERRRAERRERDPLPQIRSGSGGSAAERDLGIGIGRGGGGGGGGSGGLARTVRRDGTGTGGGGGGGSSSGGAVSAWGTPPSSAASGRGGGGAGGASSDAKVNDDIMAFYAARDELQRRRAGK